MRLNLDERLVQLLFGIGAVLLGAFLMVDIARLHVPVAYSTSGPKLFPFIIGAALIVVGAALVLQKASLSEKAHSTTIEIEAWPVLVICLGLLLQMATLRTLGWILSGAILFAATAWAFGSRRPVIDATIGLGLAAMTFLGFTFGLGLPLPPGLFAGLF